MAQVTITVPANTTSAPISVTPLSLVGIETDNPIMVRGENESVLWYSRRQEDLRSAIIIAPNSEITIEARDWDANVIVTTEDE